MFSTYVPIVLATTATGMLIPVLPLYLTDIGLSLGQAAVVLAGHGIGSVAGSLPAGAAIARVGEQRSLVVACVVLAAVLAPLGLTDALMALLVLRIAYGMASSTVRLTRQTYVTRRVHIGQRGRALTLIGGSFRIALLARPLLGRLLVDAINFRSTFLMAAAIGLTALASAVLPADDRLDLLPDVEAARGAERGLIDGVRTHWKRILWVGLVPLLVMTAREGRFVVLPFIADDLGVSPTEIGALVAITTGADLALFPVAGWILDRYGRLNAMVPAFILVAIGLVLLAMADDTMGVVVAGVVMGVGNGLSAGTMLTLGSDLAPADAAGPFLAGLSLLQGGGNVVGPLIVGIVGESLGLSAAAVALAIVLTIAVVYLVTVIGETSAVAATSIG